MAKWNLGDSASVWIEEDFKDCVIQEARGGGWYTIELKGSDTTMKCRGTQLRQSATTAPPAATVQTFTASTRGRPTIDVEMGMQPEFPPPPPTIHDLDAAILSMEEVSNPRDRALLEQVAHHASFEKWVVFTDLHVAPATLDTCLEVLTQVHQLAVERSAGVLFLGDFWHHSGTLRVDCLNAVLHHFRTWEVPMVMIPGNHDQVTLGGHSHGLTPFENAYRVGDVAGPLVLSYPTKFRDALFVPHIRDVATMESILQSSVAQESSALFVHADVKGAMMNDLIVSTNGIPTASFPKDKLIYSGHFHKPHTVKSATVKIEYLGSPYETSLSEAQQPKTLAILDSQWRCIEYFSLNIGRRHFKVSSWQDLLQLHLRTSEPLKNYSSDSVKPGDRIVVTIPKEDTKFVQPAVGSHIKSLREAGVMVEVREVKNVPLDAMGSADVGDAIRLEDMSPESTWKAYLEEEERREVISDDNARVLVEAGLEILEEIDATTTTTDPSEQSNAVTDFKLTNVSLEGFGPFREHASYPLWNRGLVLLKGTNNDSGSDR
jgi:DNA repair exonuclease SbcCD nuclease subunit